MQNANKPNSFVKGDVHPKLMKCFQVEFSTPTSVIFNSVLSSLKYPDQWKIEYGVPIPKTKNTPNNFDEIRVISKTNFLSKVFEGFLAEWMLPYIAPFLDTSQFGGLKGVSTTHYLITFLDYVHSVLDLKEPHAVLAATIDLEKAFNRVDHTLLLQDLFDMKCQSWILKILISYLSDKTLILAHNGSSAHPKPLPAGGPQGTLLGGIIFVVKFNGALLRPQIPRAFLSYTKVPKSAHMKYFDDTTAAAKIALKMTSCLTQIKGKDPLIGMKNHSLS